MQDTSIRRSRVVCKNSLNVLKGSNAVSCMGKLGYIFEYGVNSKDKSDCLKLIYDV